MKTLKVLYQEIADLTQPKCATECRLPQQCCNAIECEAVRAYAKDEHNVELKDTGHSKLPFMGPNGCIVEPYLRPQCAVHLCERQIYADLDFMHSYFKLREEIEIASAEEA